MSLIIRIFQAADNGSRCANLIREFLLTQTSFGSKVIDLLSNIHFAFSFCQQSFHVSIFSDDAFIKNLNSIGSQFLLSSLFRSHFLDLTLIGISLRILLKFQLSLNGALNILRWNLTFFYKAMNQNSSRSLVKEIENPIIDSPMADT